MPLALPFEAVVAAAPRPAFVAVTDGGGGCLRLTAVSGPCADLLGLSAEHAKGTAFPPAAQGALVGAALREAVQRGGPDVLDLDWRCAGVIRHFKLHLVPLGGELWLGQFAESTEPRSVIDKLADSEARYRVAAESGSDWVWETDREHRFTWLSPRHEALGPLRRERVIGRTRWELGAEPAEGELWRGFRARLDRHEPFRDFEYPIVRPEGEPGHVRISGTPVFAADGMFLGYRGVGRDVTLEVAVRRQAVLAESRLIDAIESLNDGFALFDAEDRLVRANRRALELAGPAAPLFRPGTPYADIVRGAAALGRYAGSAQEVEQHVVRRLAQRGNPPNRVEFQVDDGRWLRLAETRTADGGMVMVYSDVTDMKRVEAMLRRAADEAEAANQAKTEFLANMSHELRTPLNAIIGFAEIIAGELMGPAAGPRYRDYASDIRASGMHLLDVVNQILDMSKIEAGRYELREEPLDVGEIAASAVRVVERMAREAEVTLHVHIPDRPLQLAADRRALRQILLNLLSNAIKFTPAGGRVDLSAEFDAAGGAVLAVKDTGIGIATQDVAIAFAPFGQIDSPMTRQRTGTGLGLPIVKALAELHDGTVTLDSEPGAGTVVRVRFPAARVIAAHATSEMG